MIYIICPTDVATGGTEVLHQLHAELYRQGYPSSMYYIGSYNGSPVQKKFDHYQPVVAETIEDLETNALIVPEPNVDFAFRFHRIQIAIWWLSVNNYKGVSTSDKKKDILRSIKRTVYNSAVKRRDKNWLHLVQSEYARRYVIEKHQIDERNIMALSDYLSDEHFSRKEELHREDVILYNPKKGYAFTKKIIDASTDLKWAALQNMTSEQMRNRMLTAKVYIDFGAHPGKDRIPREAAMAGCCVITGKMGSAGNEKDVPITSKMKFDQTEEAIPEIIKTIKFCLSHYDEACRLYDDYRAKIEKERDAFVQEVQNLGTRLIRT